MAQTLNRLQIAETLNTSTMYKMAAQLAEAEISKQGLSRMFRDAVIIRVSQETSPKERSFIQAVADRSSQILSSKIKASTAKTVIYRHSN